jgi:PAS domain S-box-containing protein
MLKTTTSVYASVPSYFVAVLITALSAALGILLFPLFGAVPVFLILISSVMFNAMFGGFGPGVLATIIGALAGKYFFIDPKHSLAIYNLQDSVVLIVFGVIGLQISWLSDTLRSSKKRVEANARTLIESEERHRHLVDDVRDYAIIMLDVNGHVSSWNQGAGCISGYSAEEVVGKPFSLFYFSEDLDQGKPETALKVAAAEGRFEDEFRLVRKDRAVFWVNVVITALKDGSRNLFGFSLITRDITERKRVEDKFLDEKRWLEEMLNLVPLPVFLIEQGTARVTFANKAADFLSGCESTKRKSAEESQTRPSCIDEEGNRILPEQIPVMRIADGEQLNGLEIELNTMSDKRSFLLSTNTIPAMHGHAATSILVLQDITQLKQVETELRKSSQMKDEFLATVSHELRTPLTAMLGWARLLRSGKLDESGFIRALQTIERNAMAQARLIEDLLNASRIITGKLQLDIQQIDLASVIDAAINAVRPTADAKNIKLKVLVEPGVGQITGDPTRLQQVVWNLVSNSIKFTPNGGRVETRLESINSQVEITVSDSGQGISPDFLPYIFDRFRQADSTTTRRQSGLGLGLAIVRHIVELHGGTISAESPGEGQGTTFRVQLPIRAASTEILHMGRKQQVIENIEPFAFSTSLEGLRVLVVEDEPDTRELVTVLLTKSGAEVQAVGSASEVFTLLDGWRPDVLVSDIGMPGMDGYQLIRKIRARTPEQGGWIPAVALTAYAKAEDRVRAISAGFNMHVIKPVEPVELIAVIANLAGIVEKSQLRN